MSAYEFRESTIKLLRAAGWRPGRTIAVDAFERALAREGHPMPPIVGEFLGQFGKLKITVRPGPRYTRDQLRLNPCLAMEITSAHVWGRYSARIGAVVCPIGAYNYLHDMLMMTADGRVYGGYDQYLDLVGRSGEEAIDNILRGEEMWYEQIP